MTPCSRPTPIPSWQRSTVSLAIRRSIWARRRDGASPRNTTGTATSSAWPRLSRARRKASPRRRETLRSGSRRHGAVLAPASIGHRRRALGTQRQAAQGSRVGDLQAPPLAPSRQPQPLVGVVAPAEGDLVRTVGFEDPLRHLHGQQRTKRQGFETLVVSELVDDRAASPDDPELGRRGPVVDIVDAEPQRALRGCRLDQRRNKSREPLALLPARGIDDT